MMADDSLYPPDLMAELSPSQDAFVRRLGKPRADGAGDGLVVSHAKR